jgi:uncharacterized protein YdeI (YjbR/CyaY-like superfamily)
MKTKPKSYATSSALRSATFFATFFETPAHWRAWLEKNHARVSELLVGFHKKDLGKASITWPESVDEALCFGWIDGMRKRMDETSYTIRFTPRRPRSIWSAVNIRRVAELKRERRMHAAGLAAFARRLEARSAIYSYEQRKTAKLDAASERRFRGNANAWKFYEAQAPGYRRMCAWWVISAKKEETRERRLAALMEISSQGRKLEPMKPRTPK